MSFMLVYLRLSSSKQSLMEAFFQNKTTNKKLLEMVTNKQECLGSRGLNPIHYPLYCETNLIDKEQHSPSVKKEHFPLSSWTFIHHQTRHSPPCNM